MKMCSLTQSVRSVGMCERHWLNNYPRKIRWTHVKRNKAALRRNLLKFGLMKNPRGSLPDISSEEWEKHLRITAEQYQRRIGRHLKVKNHD